MITVTTDVFCDGENCGVWVHGTTGPTAQARAPRAQAAREGWARVCQAGRMVDLCPECAKKARPGNTE